MSISRYKPSLAEEAATTSEDKSFDVFQAKRDPNNLAIAFLCPVLNKGDLCIGMIVFQAPKKSSTYLKKHLFPREKEFFKSGQSATNLTVKELNVGLAICCKLSVTEHQKSASKKGAKFYMASMVESSEGIESSLRKMSKTANDYSMLTLMSNGIGVSEKH